jgi:hypothetical protein
MNLTPYLESLRQELLLIPEPEDPAIRMAAERLAARLDVAGRMILLEALSAATGEISSEMAPGSVELRLRGREPEFVVSTAHGEPGHGEAIPAIAVEGDDGGSQRTTLRLPEHLKARVDEMAAREGVSVNTWLVRAVASAVETGGRARRQGGVQSSGQRYVGWAE